LAETTAARTDDEEFARAATVMVPPPVPLNPLWILSQALLSSTALFHPAQPCGVTEKVAVRKPPSSVRVLGARVTGQLLAMAPFWITVTMWLPALMIPARATPELLRTLNVTRPEPRPLKPLVGVMNALSS
jgi:hypothetical protein